MVLLLRVLVLGLLVSGCLSVCPSSCNHQGVCNKYGRCECSEGFQGADCSERTCPTGLAWSDQAYAVDTAHALAECSNRGTCTRSSGVCVCMDGFTGSACERMTCDNNCNSNGKCLSMKDLASRTLDSNSDSYSYENIWDSKKIYGCVCDLGYEGYDCSQKICPVGDDPLTTGQVNEVQLLRCSAISGSFTLYYKGKPSTSINYNANLETFKEALLSIHEIVGIKVTFSQSSGYVCQASSNVISIEFTDNFGEQPALVAVLDSTMSDAGGVIKISADGVTSIQDNTGKSYTSVKGTKESAKCSNRGICSSTEGTCSCFATNGDVYASSDGYGAIGLRGDCGYISSGSKVSSCPGETSCSGHGVCSVSSGYLCECSAGWTGGDCSLQCSNMGKCETSSGTCTCRTGFFGDACQYMVCGGGASNPCSAHGRCMTMNELALWTEDNGDATAFTYGTDPNKVATWDAHRIHGCLCDEGWEGYDCSERTCPRGDDPGTYNQHVEVQLIKCTATSGTFTLTFRQQTTSAISVTASSSDVAAALNALSSITSVSVYSTLDGNVPSNTFSTKVTPGFPVKNLPPGDFTPPDDKSLKSPTASPTTTLLPSITQPTFKPTVTPTRLPTPSPTTSTATQVCKSDGSNTMVVVFDTVHGDVPAITSNLATVIVYTNGQSVNGYKSITGTTENDVCNHRGLCDTSTGMCSCFPGFSSSNGLGERGDLNDCGYRIIDKFYGTL